MDYQTISKLIMDDVNMSYNAMPKAGRDGMH
jgi:hypothetical protein